ncbi:MAG: hypothetical protein JWO31_1991, partial [Phycisphaerales bacterium]|nr:hypothetical protein [Phycisphaerales bacterium]
MGLLSTYVSGRGGSEILGGRSVGARRRQAGAAGRRAVSAAAARAVEPLESRTLFATYSVFDLGTLGGPTAEAVGISSDGQIAVTADLPADSSNLSAKRAGRYAGGALTDLGTFGGPDAVAAAINGAGNVAGSAADANGSFRAFLATGTTKTNLGTLGGAFSVAEAVNDNNVVVGSSQATGETGPEHGFVWQNGTMTDVGTLSNVGADYSKAYGVNAGGQVVGESATITGDVHAFRRTGTTLTDMGVLSGDSYSSARGNNDAGQVVGRSGKVVNDVTTDRAFLYNGTTMASLGTLSGDQVSQADDVNNSGLVVGFSADDGDLNDQRAVVYTAGSMQDLNALIDPAAGWKLVEAAAVNDAGQIVGVGVLNGNRRAFLLNPTGISPPPGDAAGPTATIAVPAPAAGAATVTVTVTYSDNAAVSAASIGANDLTVTRDGGAALTVTGVTTDPAADAASVVASYTVAAPGGTWDAADDGTYTVTLLSGAVTDAAGNPAASVSTPFTVSLGGNTGPSAVIGSPSPVTTAGGTSGTVTVTYTDPDAVSVASVDSADVTISGGGQAALAVTAVSASPATDGSPLTVTYTFTPPGGSWDAADDDTYTVSVNPNQVLDTTGAAAATTSAQFTVDIPVVLPTVDPTFNGGNPVGAGFVAEASVADLDGKLYVVGHSGDLTAGSSVGYLKRFNPDGSVDTTFGTAGQVVTAAGTNDAYYNVALDPSGKTVVVSGARGGDFLVARYTVRGKADGKFGTRGSAVNDQGSATEVAYGLAVGPDGAVYASGGTSTALVLLKYTNRGRPDAAFGTGGVTLANTGEVGAASALALQPDGSIVAAGALGTDVIVTRVASDGSIDPTFNNGTVRTVDQLAVRSGLTPVDTTIGLALQPDGKILVANRTSSGLFGVVRLDAAGAADPSFSGDGLATVDFGGDDDVDQVLVQGTGQIVLVGTTDAGGSPQTAVAVLDAAGNPAAGFDADGKFAVASGVTDPATSLVVGGFPVKATAALRPDGRLVTLTSSGSPTSGGAVRQLNVPGSGLVGQFGVVSGKRKTLAFTDADGTKVTLSLKTGTGTAYYDGTNLDLTVAGSTTASTVGVAAKGGDGRVRVGDVRADGALGGFAGKTTDVTGTFAVNGELRKLDVGTLSGTLATAGNLGTANFRGDLAGAVVLAGASLGADGALGGSDDTFAAAVITKFTVAGTVAASV